MAKQETVNERFKRFNSWYSEDREGYRKFAEAKRRQPRFRQEELTEIYQKGRQYFIDTWAKGETLTVSGLQMACECNRTDFKRMKHHEYDWRLYQFCEYAEIGGDDIEVRRDQALSFNVSYWKDECGREYVMNTFSEVIDHFYLLILEQIEIRCYETRGNPAGLIFALKAQFGWSDKPEKSAQSISAVHVATRREAEEALAEISDGQCRHVDV